MTNPKQVGSVDPQEITSAINTEKIIKPSDADVCYFNGQQYSAGAEVCSDGNLMRCLSDGTWAVVGNCDEVANTPADTPVTFVNLSGMTLFLYHVFGGTPTDCRYFTSDGIMNAQGRISFTIPARRTVQFYFQTAADPCDLSLNHYSLAMTGGNPKPQVLNIY